MTTTSEALPLRSLGWAVIGTGTISRSIVPDLQGLGERIVTVYSRGAEKAAAFASEFQIYNWTSNYEELLADPGVDIVYIATPFALHHQMAVQALHAGKHVLVEKPMAMNSTEVADIFAVAEKAGRFAMEAMWTKFNPAFRRLLELIEAGEIGEPRSVRAGFGIPLPADGGSRWDAARSGGALLDQGIYTVTLAHAVLGTPIEVVSRVLTNENGIDLAEHMTLEFSNGSFAHCVSSMVDFADTSAAVSGTKGWIEIPGMFWVMCALEIHSRSRDQLFWKPVVEPFPLQGHGYTPMLRAVSAAVQEGQTEHSWHTATDTLAVFRTLDQVLPQDPP